MSKIFRANGKLLLTGEYLVMDGARALVLPLKYGQELKVKSMENSQNRLIWKSYELNNCWFQSEIEQSNLKTINTSDKYISGRVEKIMDAIKRFKPEIFSRENSMEFEFRLDFNRNWGWGTSSTLLSLLAQWAGIDPYDLYFDLFKGSAYDIAASRMNQPFLYKVFIQFPQISSIDFNPTFKDKLFFVYLGQKQHSLTEVSEYRKLQRPDNLIDTISSISERLVSCNDLIDFEHLLSEHEERLALYLKKSAIQNRQFMDYTKGIVKSLGAWGGDFVLMTCHRGKEYLDNYLSKKNLKPCFTYDEIVKYENRLLIK